MRQLALDTRVSTPVIEALEKGWGERLPEPAFLGTIIQKLADRLDLDAAELNRALTEALPERDGGRRRRDGFIALSRFDAEVGRTRLLRLLFMLGNGPRTEVVERSPSCGGCFACASKSISS